MVPTKLTARMSTGGKRAPLNQLPGEVVRKSKRPAKKNHFKQLEKEAKTRSCVVLLSIDQKEVNNHAVENKAEDLPALIAKPGTSAHPIEDLSIAQEEVSLLESFINKTVKLEAEVLEKNSTLEQLRRELDEVKAEKQSLQSSLDKLKAESNSAMSQRRSQEERHLREENARLQKQIELQEEEKRSLQASLDQQKIDSDAITQRHAGEAWRLREENSKLKQQVERVEAEEQSNAGYQEDYQFCIQHIEHTGDGESEIVMQQEPVIIRHFLPSKFQQQDPEKEIAKMLIILESGERRLITFKLLEETCSVQMMLDEIGIQVDDDSNLEFVQNPGSEIDFIVKIGDSANTCDTAELIKEAESYVRQQHKQ